MKATKKISVRLAGSVLLGLLNLFAVAAFAQPANDNCSGATTIAQNGTCTAGTTVGAGDSWTGTVGCQTTNNHPDVWYTFVATGTEADITVTNGTMGGTPEVIMVQATGACAGLTLEGSLCGSSPASGVISNTLVVGATYYVTVSSSTGSTGTFNICLTTTNPPPTPGQDCPTAQTLCGATNFSVGNIAAGAGTISGGGSQEDLSTLGCLAADERRSQWYTFTVGATGTMQFLVDPVTNSNDYDWAVYNITSSGCNLVSGGATQVACNFSGCPGNTGIVASAAAACASTDYTSCAGNPSACDGGDIAQFSTSPPTLTAGNTYALVVDNFSATVSGFNFNWGAGTAVIGPNATFTTSLNASCMTVTVSRGTYYTGANMTYQWNFGDGFTSTSAVPAAHTYATTGGYTISLTVTDALGCVNTYSTTINIGCVLPVALVSFTAEKDDRDVLTEWITASELNNDYFSLERSADGSRFSEIARIKGAGNSNTTKSYRYKDTQPYSGINYYRLKQVDFDGTVFYSDIVSIDLSKEVKAFDVVPNPAGEYADLSFNSDRSGEATVNIYNAKGSSMFSSTFSTEEGTNLKKLDLSAYPSGLYFITLTRNGKVYRSRLVKS